MFKRFWQKWFPPTITFTDPCDLAVLSMCNPTPCGGTRLGNTTFPSGKVVPMPPHGYRWTLYKNNGLQLTPTFGR